MSELDEKKAARADQTVTTSTSDSLSTRSDASWRKSLSPTGVPIPSVWHLCCSCRQVPYFVVALIFWLSWATSECEGVQPCAPALLLSPLAATGPGPWRYPRVMNRTLDLSRWARLWVAVDKDGNVQASAATLDALIADVDERDLDVEIMRAPVPGEPVVFGLG